MLEAPLAAPRLGIMLHNDESSHDDWAVEWFTDPRCTNGYTWLVLDSGAVIELADPEQRTPHAGPWTTSFANSAYYGIAAAPNGLVPATPAQLDAIAILCSCRRTPKFPHSLDGAAGLGTLCVGSPARSDGWRS